MNIIITGASKGIGFETCKKLLTNENNKIIAISRSSGSFRGDHNFDNKRFTHVSLDVGVDNFNEKLIPTVKTFFGNADAIINNAGLLINKPFVSFTDADFDEIFNVNVKSVFRLVRDMIPVMNRGSHVVNITSMGGFQGSSKFPGLSLYSSSKGALSILSEAMAEELKQYGISSNALALGAVQTEMLSMAFPDFKAPLSPAEMADFIADFTQNGHKYFNGKVLPVSLSTP